MDIEPKSKTYIITRPNKTKETAFVIRPDALNKPEWWPREKERSLTQYLDVFNEQFEIVFEAHLVLRDAYIANCTDDIYYFSKPFTKASNFIVSNYYNLLAKNHPLICSRSAHRHTLLEIVEETNNYAQKIECLRKSCLLSGKLPQTEKFTQFFEEEGKQLGELFTTYQNITPLIKKAHIAFNTTHV